MGNEEQSGGKMSSSWLTLSTLPTCADKLHAHLYFNYMYTYMCIYFIDTHTHIHVSIDL